MGKIQFPLKNIRRDVTGTWKFVHYTGSTSEQIEVPYEPDEYGYYTASLIEIPDNGSVSGVTSPPIISGLTEVKVSPINASGALTLTSTQFWINYQTGTLLFHPDQAGKTFAVDYWGKGSLAEVEEVNNLHERLLLLENGNIIGMPEFSQFYIQSQSQLIEVGSSISAGTLVFRWLIDDKYLDYVKDNSIQITNVNTSTTLASGLANNFVYSYTLSDEITNTTETSQTFRIAGVNQINQTFYKDFIISWKFPIYYGEGSLSTTVDETFVKSLRVKTLNSSHKTDYTFESGGAKFIAYPVSWGTAARFIDTNTGFQVVMYNNPETISITNSYGIQTDYYVYRTLYELNSTITIEVV